MSVPPELVAFARRLASAARSVTLPAARDGVGAEDKGGGAGYDPVTEADRGAERAMRDLIEAEHPDHGIAGEEFGVREGSSRWSWSLDPIDGTRAFVCGLPSWTTLIALLDEGRPVLGIVDTPRLDELCLGHGGEALLVAAGGERRIATSGCARLGEARISTTDPALFDAAGLEAFDAIRSRARLVRYGLDGYGYARVAAGTLDLVVEAGLKPHDYNALIPLVRAAGGCVGDWRGGDDYRGGQVVAAATPALFEEALSLLEPASA